MLRRLCLLLAALIATPATARPVLLISIDGLRPGDVLEADARGLKVPNLRALVAAGAHAREVHGVLPTVTYPSHTTLITGASPARHGIVNNQTFDPLQINHDGWFYYATDIKVPTLWDAAHGAGLSTGNVHWPVSVGARAIDFNLPQIWTSGHPDDAKLLAALATPGLVARLEATEGTYAAGIDESVAGDAIRARFAARLIALEHPQFLTVYLTGLDTTQHHSGPDTADAHAALEAIDADVGQVVAAERAAHPDAAVAVVSDHGFAAVKRGFNPWRAFIDAGLVRGGDGGPGQGGWKIREWDAVPWPSGGSVAVVLARPDDAALVLRVQTLLIRLAGDPANGIARVIDAPAIAAAGGNPRASFYLELAPDVMALPFRGPELPVALPVSPYKGMHGWFPTDPRMVSTFVIAAPGVPAGRDLGVIDMRAIAPTLASELGVTLAGAELAPISLR